MKQVALLYGYFLLLCFTAGAQTIPGLQNYTTNPEKLERLHTYCDSLLLVSNLEALDSAAVYALSITPKNDLNNLAVFTSFRGNACEGTSATDAACIKLYNDALNYANASRDIIHIVDAAGPLMTLYEVDLANAPKRDSLATMLKKILDTTQNDKAKANIMEWLVQHHTSLEQNDTALQYSIRAVEIAKKLFARGDVTSDYVANALYRLTQSFRNMQQPDKQLQYLLEMRPYIKQNVSMLAICYLTIAEDHIAAKKPDLAERYYDSLANLAAVSKTNTLLWNNLLELELNFAQNYIANYKDYDKAMVHAKRAVELGKTWGYSYFQANINYTMGSALLARKEYQNAVPFLTTGAALAKSHYSGLYMACLRKVSKAYGGLGNWQAAYRYADTLAVVKDSLDKIDTDRSFADAEARYQNKEKQQQIEIKNIQLDAGKKQRLWLISGAALLAVVVVLLVVIYRNKKKTADVLGDKNITLNKLNTALEEANQTKARLFSIIGHDLRSPINQVYQFLKLQQLNPGKLNEVQRGELSQKIQTATGSLLETMEDLLLWSKTQMTQFTADIQRSFVQPIVTQVTTLLHLNSEAKNITVIDEIPAALTVITDPYFLQTIMRNLVQNAIKASPASGKITIAGFEENSRLVLTIQNSGPAFTQQAYEGILAVEETGKSLSGLGLRLVNELSLKIGAKIRFTASAEGDTVAQIIFPVV